MNTQVRPKLALQAMEERANPSSFVSNGDLYIYGTGGNDHVEVRYETYGGVGYFKVTDNGVNKWFAASQVWGGDIVFYGFAGNDYINNFAGSLRLNAYGGDGDDTLIGDAASDRLYGQNGNDVLHGYGGNDALYGGNGNDILYGYSGNDYLSGGYGYDQLYGSYGDDVLDGGIDGVRDYLNGGDGHDKFRKETYWWFFNRDKPVDFQSGIDSYYS